MEPDRRATGIWAGRRWLLNGDARGETDLALSSGQPLLHARLPDFDGSASPGDVLVVAGRFGSGRIRIEAADRLASLRIGILATGTTERTRRALINAGVPITTASIDSIERIVTSPESTIQIDFASGRVIIGALRVDVEPIQPEMLVVAAAGGLLRLLAGEVATPVRVRGPSGGTQP